MPDIDNIKMTVSADYADALRRAEDWYPILLAECTIRTQNVLMKYRQGFYSSADFYKTFFSITRAEVKKLKNCGPSTASEILGLSEQLKQYTEWQGNAKFYTIPVNIDKLLPIIINKTERLSARAKNAIKAYISLKNKSVRKLYESICRPNFSADKIANIGKSTQSEVVDFLDEIKTYIEQFYDIASVETEIEKFYAPKLSDISIKEEYWARISELKEQLGYFPLFAAISAYLEGLNDETKIIIDGGIRVHKGQIIIERNEIAERLGLSAERVRQKRLSIIEDLAKYFACIRKVGFISGNPYSYIMTHTEDYVNSTEGTDFTANFVRWVLGTTFEEVTLIGDITKPLTYLYNDNLFVNIVPTELCQYFDFSAYVAALDEKLAEKRTDEERVNLKSFMQPFFKVKYYEDQEKDNETACRSILYLTYGLEVDMGQIIFKPNKRKNNPDIIEDILRAAGHPMTIDEIYDEFMFQYPDRSLVYESFRGNIGKNKNIVPISRTSTYALAEWQNGDYRGGTIREFVSEYLDSLPSHIATVEATGDYVRQFRPTSSNESIVSNLSQDKTQKYAIYTRDDQKYIGYRDYTYDLSFVLFDPERVTRRPVEESMRLLRSFINEHRHFPLNQPNDPEETRLYRFVDVMRSLYNRGKMDDATATMWRKFYDEYGVYRLPRKTAEEVDFISLKIREYLNTIDWPYGFRNIDEIIGQALDYYVRVYEEDDKNETIRPFLCNCLVNGKHVGRHYLEYIIDRYALNTKRSSNWDGKEWITEDVLKFFEYDDEAIEKWMEEMARQRQLIENLKNVQNNLG